jgi:conjugative transfer region protein TrbK
MNRSLVWGIAFIIILGAAALAGRTVPDHRATASAAPTDPELARCRAAGEPAGRDPACHKAWEAARRAFFGRSAS